MKSLLSIFLCLMCFCNQQCFSRTVKNVYASSAFVVDYNGKLLEEILKNYTFIAMPMENGSASTLKVDFGASLLEILSLSDAILNAAFWFEMGWKDYRLTWDSAEYGGIDTIHIPAEQIWKPDLMIYNGLQGSQGAANIYADVNVVITSDGKVTYIAPMVVTTTCPISKSNSSHNCLIRIGSWTYSDDKLKLTPTSESVGLYDYAVNSQWDLVDTDLVRNAKTYDCCPETYVTVDIHLQISPRPTGGRKVRPVRISNQLKTEG